MTTSLTRETLKIFWNHGRRYGWQLFAIVFGAIFTTLVQNYLPLLSRDLINVLVRGISSDGFKAALHIVWLILFWSLARLIIWRLANFVNNDFTGKIMRDLANTCYQYLQHHSAEFFNSSFVGSLVTKVKRYEKSFDNLAEQIIFNLGNAVLNVVIILAVLFWQYRTFGWILLAWCVVFFIFITIFTRYKIPFDIKRAAADTRTTAQLADSITNNTNIKLFTNYEAEERRFGVVTHDQFTIRKKSWNLGTLGDVFQGASMVIMEFIVMAVALRFWQQGTLTIGDIALLQAYLGRLFDKLWNTGNNIRTIYEALADANEMTEMLLKPHGIQDVPNAGHLRVDRGGIAFKDVSFGYYKESAILNNFNLKIAPGERVAFIGASGGGKSTIVKLLFRFYDLTGGEIAIDDQSIAAVTQDSLRAALAFVPQEPVLFHRTLMENIRYAKPDATDEEVVRAAKLAHAHEFIESFTNGYETLVGERGVKLSGGERQRVAIARAILKDAPILVLDEATSSLDSESEQYIQDALKKLMQNRTTIVVAHRLSTIMQMDRIVVIGGGTIIEEGKHEELLKVQQGTYQKLWGIQAGGFAAQP